jgi:nucleotide-binding universal stress UspA family protein
MSHPNESRYRSLLVPLDGSIQAEHALPAAASLARRHRAALHLVRVYMPVAGVEGERAVPYDETLDRELMKRARGYLDDMVTRLAAVAGGRSDAAMLEGSVPDAISRHAAAVGADLIVMTTQGRGPLVRFWLGSVSDELVRQAGVPILFVRPHAAPPDLSHPPAFERVLVPLDGSTLAEQILEPALTFAAAAPAEYTLLHVVTTPAELSYGPAGGEVTGFRQSLKRWEELNQQQLERAREDLERLAAPLRARSLAVNTRAVCHASPATAILKEASARGADLIALATRGRGRIRRLILGSVADKVLRGADTAVLVYRPADESAAVEPAPACG